MASELENVKPCEDFVARFTTVDGEKLTVRVGRFRREAQRESGRGSRYIQQGIKIFSTHERGTGLNRKQFPEAEYWDDKDFELVDLPYITVWLFEASTNNTPSSLENFLQSLEVFMGDPKLVPSKFFERHITPFNSIEDFFRQMNDFLAGEEVLIADGSATKIKSAKRPDYSQLEFF